MKIKYIFNILKHCISIAILPMSFPFQRHMQKYIIISMHMLFLVFKLERPCKRLKMFLFLNVLNSFLFRFLLNMSQLHCHVCKLLFLITYSNGSRLPVLSSPVPLQVERCFAFSRQKKPIDLNAVMQSL